ncbi:MAG: hypothetical protein K2Q14_03355 [Gammaproteobacteria bacterium]|nr:hypothetical protein [Gammaproteobacteria bacterium]
MPDCKKLISCPPTFFGNKYSTPIVVGSVSFLLIIIDIIIEIISKLSGFNNIWFIASIIALISAFIIAVTNVVVFLAHEKCKNKQDRADEKINNEDSSIKLIKGAHPQYRGIKKIVNDNEFQEDDTSQTDAEDEEILQSRKLCQIFLCQFLLPFAVVFGIGLLADGGIEYIKNELIEEAADAAESVFLLSAILFLFAKRFAFTVARTCYSVFFQPCITNCCEPDKSSKLLANHSTSDVSL